MANYGVAGPVTLLRDDGSTVQCWELYRKKRVKGGLIDSTYFDIWTFKRCYPKSATLRDRLWDVTVPKCEYIGIVKRWGQKMFHWQVTLRVERRSYTCDFYCGMGWVEADKLTPRTPTLHEVLCSLQLDCFAATDTLEQYVSEFGDSPTAAKTWRACRKLRTSIERLFGSRYESFLNERLEC